MSDTELTLHLKLIAAEAAIAAKIAERGPWPRELEGTLANIQSHLDAAKALEKKVR